MKSILITTLVCLAVIQPIQSLAQATLPGADDAYQKLKAKADKRFPSSTSGLSGAYDCNEPEAQRLSKYDNAGYARMFFAAFCKCKKGVTSEQEERQLIAQMKSMKHSYNNRMSDNTRKLKKPVPASCDRVSSSGGGGSNELSREAEIQRTMNNIRVGINMRQKALNRSRQTSRELNQLADIVNTGDPFEIANNFNQIMNRIDDIDKNLREQINIGYIEDASTAVSQYSSGNMEGALGSALVGAANISTNQEAKREVERKRQEAISQKNKALRQAANDMIEANNSALHEYIKRVALCVAEDRELYYLKKAIFHSCYARSIDNNFSYSNTNWANNPCKPVEKPAFRTYYNPMHEQHYEAAIRKKKLYEEYKNEELLEGATQHMSAAIDLQPKNAKYYLELGRIAYPNDMVLSSINYLSAYSMSPNMFDLDIKTEMFGVLKDASMEAASAIENNNTALVRDYLDADLFEIIEVDGSNLFSYAAETNKLSSLELIYNRHINQLESSREKRKLMQEAIVAAAYNNSTQSLQFLLEQGYHVDFSIIGKTPLDYAAEGDAPGTFLICWKNSKQQQTNLRKYGSSLIYIEVMAYEDAEAAAQALCRMNGEKLINSIKTLIEQSSRSSYYLKPIMACPEALKLSKENNTLQKEFNVLFNNCITINDNPQLSAKLLRDNMVDANYLRKNAIQLSTNLIRADQTETFRLFAEKGFLSSKSTSGLPLCFEFIKYGDNILKAGLAKGLDFNLKDNDGAGILHNLAFVPSSSNAVYLVNNCNININQKGPHEWTPLHFAIKERNTELATLLLSAGADKTIKDEWNRKPYKIAKEREFDNMKTLLK